MGTSVDTLVGRFVGFRWESVLDGLKQGSGRSWALSWAPLWALSWAHSGHTRGPTRGVEFRSSRALCLSDCYVTRNHENHGNHEMKF